MEDGNYVEIDHGNGYVSKYFHMTTGSVAVSVGDKVKKGQVIGKVGTTGASSGPHCHFQIEFNGNKIDPLSFKYNNGMGNGNGGFGVNSEDSDNDKKEDKKSDNKKEDKDVKKATVIQETGDGYIQKYTSSAGITYTEFKQFQGSYSENSYWDGTIHSSGCGPTSVAILMSGLTNKNYTPADTAAEMKSKYGYTSYETLQKEMNDVGLTSEVIQSPSAEQIQNNLRNGKVMLVSVNSATIFTGGSHIMTLIDINDQGQVYIANPSSTTLNGWWDISDIMKGCQYVVVTDAGASGVASSSNTSGYAAVVATWNQVDTTVTTNDPNVKAYSETKYSMTTTDVNYEEMVDPYTMPFDLLWALLVVGEDRQFVFELADLVYNSDIEITIHDNVTTNTDIDAWTYAQREKAIVNGSITANCGGNTATAKIENDEHEKDYPYATTKTVVTQTDTINVALTKANVWIVDYEKDYTYVSPTSSTSGSRATVEDKSYHSVPDKTGNSYNCEHINAKKQELAEKVQKDYNSVHTDTLETSAVPSITYTENINVSYYNKYVNMVDNITNKVKSQSYMAGLPDLKEKTDKDTAPNFVTIYKSKKHEVNRRNISSASKWLFEIIETNDSTADMLDLIKYLLYKATGANYGVKEFDFSVFDPANFNRITTGSGAEGGLSLTTTMFTKDVFKQALQAYYDKTHNQAFYQNFLSRADELYDTAVANNLNPELAVITAKSEGGFRESGGSYNYWGIAVPNGASSGKGFSSYAAGVAGYAKVINSYTTGWYAAAITENYEKRKAAGCDPTGYGLPGTLSGMQSIYSSLGRHVHGSAGEGGYYYMDPARAGVTKIYKTHEEFVQKCQNAGGEHAAGTTTTVWEQGQYTAWQVEQKLQTWTEIFGSYGSLDSSNNNNNNKTKNNNKDKKDSSKDKK